MAAKGHFDWDAETEKYQQKNTTEKGLVSSDEEDGPNTPRVRCKRKSRKRKRSCLDSTPFRNFCSVALDDIMDSTFQTSDSEPDDRPPPPMAAVSWMDELMESCYYDTDIPCNKGMHHKITIKSEPASPCGDTRENMSEGSIELDSSFYDSDCEVHR